MEWFHFVPNNEYGAHQRRNEELGEPATLVAHFGYNDMVMRAAKLLKTRQL